jgi:hypothetical protein
MKYFLLLLTLAACSPLPAPAPTTIKLLECSAANGSASAKVALTNSSSAAIETRFAVTFYGGRLPLQFPLTFKAPSGTTFFEVVSHDWNGDNVTCKAVVL